MKIVSSSPFTSELEYLEMQTRQLFGVNQISVRHLNLRRGRCIPAMPAATRRTTDERKDLSCSRQILSERLGSEARFRIDSDATFYRPRGGLV